MQDVCTVKLDVTEWLHESARIGFCGLSVHESARSPDLRAWFVHSRFSGATAGHPFFFFPVTRRMTG